MDKRLLQRVKLKNGHYATNADGKARRLQVRGPNRRRFLQGIAALAPVFGQGFRSLFAETPASSHTSSPEYTVFVGTQTGPDSHGSQGIYAYTWDPNAGSLRLKGLAAATPMPTFLTLSADKSVLFAANETDSFDGAKSGGVSSFHVAADPKENIKLAPINSEVSGGAATCYVGLDHTGRVLLCANYTGGSASSFKVARNGEISAAVSHFQYTGTGPDHERQEAPHIHRAMASPGNKFALFNDLGLDVIHIYALDPETAKLTPHNPPVWHAPAGSGPRALRFHPTGPWAYCVTEMGSSIMVLDWDEAKGTLTTKQQVSLIPAGFKGRSQASDVVIDRSGRFIYAADRYYDGIYSFTIDPRTGEIHDMVRTPAAGKTPRFITLDPTEKWLLSADQDSDSIAIYKRDVTSGRLVTHGTVVPQNKPQCLVFV